MLKLVVTLTHHLLLQLEYQRQQLLQERQQFHMEQIRAAEYRARQFANQQLTDSKPQLTQHGDSTPSSSGAPPSVHNPALAAAVGHGSGYVMHGSPMPPQGPQVSFFSYIITNSYINHMYVCYY